MDTPTDPHLESSSSNDTGKGNTQKGTKYLQVSYTAIVVWTLVTLFAGFSIALTWAYFSLVITYVNTLVNAIDILPAP